MSLYDIRNRFLIASGRKDLAKESNLITNSELTYSPYGWDLTTGWSWSTTKMTHTAGVGNTGALSQFYGFARLVVHGYYKVTLTVSGMTAGTLIAGLGTVDQTDSQGVPITEDGTYSFALWCQSPQISLFPTWDFDGDISNVTIIDLAVTHGYDSSETNADSFINDGIKWLDSFMKTPASQCRYHYDIAIGDYTLELKYCRSIEKVYAIDATNGYMEVEKKPLEWMKENYGGIISDITGGTPAYYAINIIGMSPDQLDLTLLDYSDEFTYGYDDIHFGDSSNYRGIIFMPPADTIYTIAIIGRFDSKPLVTGADANWWTENRPAALVMASLYHLELYYNNMTRAAEFRSAALEQLHGIEKDMVREKVARVKVMGE